jgi:hypothetical protein
VIYYIGVSFIDSDLLYRGVLYRQVWLYLLFWMKYILSRSLHCTSTNNDISTWHEFTLHVNKQLYFTMTWVYIARQQTMIFQHDMSLHCTSTNNDISTWHGFFDTICLTVLHNHMLDKLQKLQKYNSKSSSIYNLNLKYMYNKLQYGRP